MDTPLQNLAVIGAGAMGSGIAALFALKGLDVVLVDPMEGALDRARAVIERQLNVYAPGQVDAVMQRIRMAPGLDAAAACDLVIEAVPENLLPRETEDGYIWETMPSAELSNGQKDPMKWFYHDWLVGRLLGDGGAGHVDIEDRKSVV